jgi:hypothetical protein
MLNGLISSIRVPSDETAPVDTYIDDFGRVIGCLRVYVEEAIVNADVYAKELVET